MGVHYTTTASYSAPIRFLFYCATCQRYVIVEEKIAGYGEADSREKFFGLSKDERERIASERAKSNIEKLIQDLPRK